MKSVQTSVSFLMLLLLAVFGLTGLQPAVSSASASIIRINFQPATSSVPAGYLVDSGTVYGNRGNGYQYGWNVNHTDMVRQRAVNADQRLDTISHFHAGGSWQIAVPNGSYNVFVSIGDPSYSSSHTINVENVNFWNALNLNTNQFATKTLPVTVSDGNLTVNQGTAGEMMTRINYLEIYPAGAPTPTPLPVVCDPEVDTSGSLVSNSQGQVVNHSAS